MPAACFNCLSNSHAAAYCPAGCGHCGRDGHVTDRCTSAQRNRCKCAPFPQFHLVKNCAIRCGPECLGQHGGPGNHTPPAMVCSARCCMCGIPGHAGRDCHLKACRCNGQHLTIQHPQKQRACIVSDCPRWFCTKHCQHCGDELERLRAEKCRSCGAGQTPPASLHGINIIQNAPCELHEVEHTVRAAEADRGTATDIARG
ncbi:hypothetical protein CCHL11_09286 [Colletotrichum chlorophyti]|uniref:CCHC-type domain-containing protein n=1 Tax=Colletotrichum chlorophyti TaxID=708187 RepID=A0A1Q8RSP6_9PEZI|nr:hypothetical protein CCHL11_09286 [Colletotrichum chlorophyti]